MENKDQNNTVPVEGALNEASFGYGVVKEPPPDPNALSLEPTAYEPLISQEQPKGKASIFLRLVRRLDVMLAVLLLIVGAAVLFTVTRKNAPENTKDTASNTFGTVSIPLGDIVEGRDLTLSGISNVTINGLTQLNNGLYLSPTLQPTGAKPGQIYFDKTTSQLAYFNGEAFVFLTGPAPGGVQSLGGAVGQLTLGTGLNMVNNQLTNSGVLSVQGQNGDITLSAGPGIVINGTNFSNSGVIGISAGSPNVVVSNDGNGNVTLSVTSGAGTITSSGGTAGSIPLYTSSQNIEDSIITQSGLTVTISGDLSVVTGGLTLSNALTVSNGGTGATSLAANGVLVGNGTAAISSVAAAGAGLCLLSTAGAPAWGACPSGSGVTSLNSLTGALSIANASAAGSTITIDDASTVSKGIASFNSTNFSVSGGAVNTVQNINTAATPTFVGVNTNTITPSAALTVGVSAQTALLQGSTTTITSNGAGNNIVLNSAATIELQDDTNVTGGLTTSGDVAVNGGDITSLGALNITPGGTLTVGVSSQTLTLQGGATSSFRATNGANTTIVAFTSPTANTTLNFPALAAGTYTICTTSGNCAGAAATLQSVYDNSTNPEIILDATRGALTIRDNATPLGANLLEVQNNAGSATYLGVTTSGIAVTGTATISSNVNSTAGALQTNSTNRIDNSGNLVNIGNIALSGTISGGTTITGSGDINTTAGGIQTNSTTRVDNSGNLINIAAVTASGNATFQGGAATLGTNAQAGTLVLNDGSSNTGTLQVAALGQNTVYTLPDPGAGSATICLSSGNCSGAGGGVTTGGGTNNRLAKFTGAQTIGDSSISDDGTNVTVSVDVIIQGGDLTLGTTSQTASFILHDGNGQTTTLQAGDSVGNLTFILPTNAGVANQCLKQSGTGNQLVWQDCDGGSGGSSATLQTAYNNSTNPEITLNSSVGGLTIRDNATPLGTNLFEIQNNAGGTTYLAVTVSGLSVTGTATASGTINSSGGAIQTNSTNRIDNSGNLVNIGNITGTGAITIASIGAGNDITVDGADQFIVQDASAFNALATFNANIDLGGNDLIGTTGDINLTNFDVDGATGNVTAGTINGQTISSAANFTGTVAVAGNTTLTGDIAVNGGDLTSTGPLNITPGGTLTVGVTGQQLVLQGSANTQLTATGGGFTTTIGFTGSPTAAVTYNFDRAAAVGTYTICTSIGNCAGSGGGVTTSGGTTGTLPKFTGAQTIGDSLISESGSTITVNGNLNVTTGNQFQLNGTQISSAVLSNDSNLAKLSASQTFTGNTVAFQNAANSTNAFNIQNQAGNRILTADSTNAQVILGTGSALDGKLVFHNVSNGNTVTISSAAVTANRTLTLPDASGVICTDSGNCAGAGATLQTAYNFSVGGTTPKIKVNSSLGGVDIQDADTPIGANLLNVRASNGAGLGSVMFGVGNTGQVTLQNSANSTTAFRVLTQGGTAVATIDTTNGLFILGQGGTLAGSLVLSNATNTNLGTLQTAVLAQNTVYTLPDPAAGSATICLNTGNCLGGGGGGANTALSNLSGVAINTTLLPGSAGTINVGSGTLPFGDIYLAGSSGTPGANNFRITGASTSGTNTITLPDASGTVCLQSSTSCGFAPTSGSTNYIQNAPVSQQTANFDIITPAAGTIAARIEGAANMSTQLVLVKAGSNPSANTLEVQNSAGTQIMAVHAGTARVTIGTTCSFGQLCVNRNTTGAGGSTVINSYNQQTMNVSGATTFQNQNIIMTDTSSAVANTLSPVIVDTSGTTNTSATINSIYAKTPASAAGTFLQFDNGSNTVLSVTNSGVATFQPTANGDTFRVNNSGGGYLFNINTNTNVVGIGNMNVGVYNVTGFYLDNAVGTDIQIGNTNATAIGIGRAAATTTVTGTLNQSTGTVSLASNGASSYTSAGATTITAGATSTWSTSAGDLSIQSAGTLNMGNAGGTAINIGTNNAAHTIGIGNTGATGTQAITIGGSGNTANTLVLEAGTGATAIQIGNGNTNHGIQIGTGTGIQTVVLGSTSGASATTVNAGTGNLLLNTNSSSASIIARSSTNGTSAFQVQNAGSVAVLNVDTTNARVSVGTGGTATGQLYVAGMFSGTPLSTITPGEEAYDIAAQGRYLYARTATAVRVVDASRPDSLATVSTYSLSSGGGEIEVAGNRAYVIANGNFYALDISNPKSLSTLSTTAVTGALDLAVQGRYAYIATNDTSNPFYVYDVSNPASPIQVSSTNITGSPFDIVVQGRYVYYLTSGNILRVLDVGNPASVSVAGSLASLTGLAQSLAVQGRYVYVAGNGGATGSIQAVDVSDPTTPTSASTLSSVGGTEDNIIVQGRYAYLGGATLGSLAVVDITNPASMSLVTDQSGPIASGMVAVGRYLYMAERDGFGTGYIRSYDMGGGYAQQFEAGGIEASTLQVTQAATVGQLNVTGGLSVGSAMQLNGSIGVSGDATFRSAVDSSFSFRIQDSSGNNILVGDTLSNRAIQIGGGSASSTSTHTVLVLDNKSTAGDPTATYAGGMYYNSNSGKFRCYTSAWVDCITPGGSNTQLQFNDGGSLGGEADLVWDKTANSLTLGGTDTGIVMLGATNEPSAPSAGNLRIYTKSIAGRLMPKWKGPNGNSFAGQPAIFGSKIDMLLSKGTDTIDSFGITRSGCSLSAPTIANTDLRSSLRRTITTSSSSTANSACDHRANNIWSYWRGNAAGLGGWFYSTRFMLNTTVSNQQVFVGLAAYNSGGNTTIPGTQVPSALTDMVGVGWDSADGNLQFMRNDSTGTATKVDLGASFPANNTTAVYEFNMYAPPNGSTIAYEVTRLDTGSVSANSYSTDLPTNTTFLAHHHYINNGGTAAAVALEFIHLYIETDY